MEKALLKKDGTNKGVVINGVKWATHNVAAPGTFTTKPEEQGMLYQWNCKVPWTTEDDVTNWNDTYLTDENWKKNNDPSPVGWRVPTSKEIGTLLSLNVADEWTTLNGRNGRKFTDKATGNLTTT